MKKLNWKSVSKGFAFVSIFVLLSGLLSYVTTDGKAAFGLNPLSVEVQQTAIAINTFWWFVAMSVLGLLAYFKSKRIQTK